jgi:hypothetical protein
VVGVTVTASPGAVSRALRSGSSLLLCAASWLLQPLASSAQERSASVTLIQEPCPGYDAGALASLLAIDLRMLGIRQVQSRSGSQDLQAANSGLAVVHLRCAPDPETVTAEVADLATGNRVERELPIGDVEPEARTRALALAIATMVETSWLEVAIRKPGGPDSFALPVEVRLALRKRLRAAYEDSERPPALRSQRTGLLRPPARSAIALLGASRSFPARNTGLLGMELVFVPVLASTRLLLTADALFGSQEVNDQQGLLANMHLMWLSAGVAVMWASLTRPELSVGPYARVGYASATATPQRAGTKIFSGGSFVTALGLSALLRAELRAGWDAWFGVDVGYVPSGVVFLADASRSAGMAEVTMAARAGIGLHF